jgi:hypothetical protein
VRSGGTVNSRVNIEAVSRARRDWWALRLGRGSFFPTLPSARLPRGRAPALRYVPASTPGERPPRCSPDAALRRYRAAVERWPFCTHCTVLRTAAAAVSAVLTPSPPDIIEDRLLNGRKAREGMRSSPCLERGELLSAACEAGDGLRRVCRQRRVSRSSNDRPLFQFSAGRYQQLRACHRFCPELPLGQGAPRPLARFPRGGVQ